MEEEEKEWDGRKSVEHQIEIHVNDLLQVYNGKNDHHQHGGYTFSSSEVYEILVGLQYVLDYHLRQQPVGGGVQRRRRSLDYGICERLVRSLLLVAGHMPKKRSLFRSGTSEQLLLQSTQLAFILLVDFCLEVCACMRVFVSMDSDVLRENLKLYTRMTKTAESDAGFRAAIALLNQLHGAKLLEWTELFDDDHLPKIRTTLADTNFFDAVAANVGDQNSRMHTTLMVYPPTSLCFDRDPHRVLEIFGSDENQGLPTELYEQRHEHYWPNEIPTSPPRSWWSMLWSQCTDVMIVILIATTIVSAAIDYPKVGSAIVLGLVVVLNVAVGFWQEFKSSQTVEAMRSLDISCARVRRAGVDQIIPSSDLVPGDIVVLAEGDCVPADLRLINANRLETNEAILTGESISVAKSSVSIKGVPSRKLPLTKCVGNAFMGTMVTRGTGVGIAVRTGSHTEIGSIGAVLASERKVPRSVLKKRLAFLGKILVMLAIVLCGLVALIAILQGESRSEAIRLSVSLAVSVIPEGLVAILTVTVALAIRKLAKRGALVRRINAIETLGSVSVIAADKTGTLTEGCMQLQTIWSLENGLMSVVPEKESKSADQPTLESKAAKFSHYKDGSTNYLIKQCSILCNNASINDRGKIIGEATESALLAALGPDESYRVRLRCTRLEEIPFDSERKMMSVIVSDEEGKKLVFSKGAAEMILSNCTAISCRAEPLESSPEILETINRMEYHLSDQGLRVLALAYKRLDEGDPVETELTFLGLVGLMDPPRETVQESVRLAEAAGIRVCMITGDNVRTAVAIAKKLGIYDDAGIDKEKSRVIHGRDLDLITVEELAQLQPFPCVFARVSPQNKLMVVKALQLQSEIVSMTGDGVNDVPAIRKADVGIAMGQSGTEIARDAAALILLTDNFPTIIDAVSEGRQMYRNVTLFIVYLLSCNSAEIWTILVALLLRWKPPLSSMNILWANIIADIPPSMCLALERDPISSLMHKMDPKGVSEQVTAANTWILVAVNGATLAAVTLVVYGRDKSGSEAFLILIGLQLILAPMSRSTHESIFRMSFFGNPWLLASVVFSFGLLLLGIYVPMVNDFLELEPLSWMVWVKFIIGAILLLLINETTKVMIRRFLHR